MYTLNGDNLIETVEKVYDVKEIRAKIQALNAQIDEVKLEPDIVPNFEKSRRLEELRSEKQNLKTLLSEVNLT